MDPNAIRRSCQRALAISGISHTSVDAILKNGLDRSLLLVEAPPKIIAIDHANACGSSYYQQLLLEA